MVDFALDPRGMPAPPKAQHAAAQTERRNGGYVAGRNLLKS
jgi:hypothetical protein